MTEAVPVRLPQINVNDESAEIEEWVRSGGDHVRRGETICVVETSKSVVEIESPADGYLNIVLQDGERATIGQILAMISAAPATSQDLDAWLNALNAGSPAESAEKRWTQKAEILARRHGIDLAKVSASKDRITEADVQNYLAAQAAVRPSAVPEQDLMDDRYPAGRSQRLLVIGGGNGAIQILDVVMKTPSQRVVAILDDNSSLHGKQIAGVPISGAIDLPAALDNFHAGLFDAAVISVSTSIDFRGRIYDAWREAGIPFANIIHPTVDVGMNVAMGSGNVILSFCHLGPCATIGNNNFLSPYCSIEHHAVMGDHCSLGPGVVTSSSVQIGDRVRFGTGIFIEPHLKIGSGSLISSGCVITENIPAQSVLKSRSSYVRRQRQGAS